MAHTPLTKVENLVLGRGICFFAPFDANGLPMGERDLGEVSGLTVTITSEVESYYSSRTATRKKIREWVTQVDFEGAFTANDLSAENLALILAGSTATVTQAATPVTNERIRNAESNREYQLGASTTHVAGVRNVSSVTVKLYELANAAARVDSTAYTVGQIYKVSADVFLVTTQGTSAGSPPSMVTTSIGASTTDGGATVKFIGTTGAFTVADDYLLNAASGRIGIEPDGDIAAACDLYTEVTGDYLSLSVDYTPAAETRDRTTTSGSGSIAGQFRFIADNSEGTNRDLFISSCKISPNGELPFIGDTTTASVEMRLGINEKDSSTPQIILDGRA